MADGRGTAVTVETRIQGSRPAVWELWTVPEHIMQWNSATDEWHTPRAENDLRVGGKFLYRMEAKDGSMGFDFWGVYDEVKTLERIACTLGDGRKVIVTFLPTGADTHIVETFEAETENPVDMQRGGWQAILDNFKRYAEKRL